MLLTEKMNTLSFTDTEQIIVQYLLSEKQNIATKKLAQLANECYVSKSAFVRIAQKLGYSGWNECKAALLQEFDYLSQQQSNINANLPFTATDNLSQIAHNLLTLKKETLDETLQINDYPTLEKAVNLLNQTQTIHLFAVSNNLLLAEEFAHQMSRIGKEVRIHHLQNEIYFSAYLASSNSCALIISYSGNTNELIQVAKLLTRKKIPIISITSLGENHLRRYAKYQLSLPIKEKLYSKISTFATDTAIIFLLELLYSGVFVKDFDTHLKMKISASRIIEHQRTSDTDSLKEEKS